MPLQVQASLSKPSASPEQKYMDFLKKYELLSNAYDFSAVDMYSENAVIKYSSSFIKGMETTSEIKGPKFKELAQKLIQSAKNRGEQIEYADIKISIDWNKAKITATRYSSATCSKDNKYYMVIKEQENGELKIIEEFFERKIKSKCEAKDFNFLESVLKNMEEKTNRDLPIMLDEVTQLFNTEAKGQTFFLYYEVANSAFDDMSRQNFRKSMSRDLIKRTCVNLGQNNFLKKGVTFTHVYSGTDGKEIASITINTNDCKNNSL